VTLLKRSSYVILNGMEYEIAQRNICFLLSQWFNEFTALNHLEIPTDKAPMMEYTWILNLLSTYYFIRLYIVKHQFLEHSHNTFQDEQGQKVLAETMFYLRELQKVFSDLSKHNPNLTSIPLFFKHCVVSSAAFHCILIHYCPNEAQSAVTEHIDVLKTFSVLFGTISLDIEMISHWIQNPFAAHRFLESV
jgi:hypothetical protein